MKRFLLLTPFFLFFLLAISVSFTAENSNFYIDKNVKESKKIILKLKNKANPEIFQLFSHGKSGELFLHNHWMKKEEIVLFLKNVLSENITYINIYACEFGKGKKGTDAVRYIEKQLGVKISASTNITGKDGDWKLEIGNNKGKISIPDYSNSLQCAGIIGGTSSTDDFDADGICNNIDIDDDNDGILDAVESPSCFYTATEANTLVRIRSSLASPDDDQADGDIQMLHDGLTTLTFNYTAGQTINGASLLIMEYPTAVQLSQLSFVNNTAFGTSATARLEGSQDGITWVNLGNGNVDLNNATSPKTFNNTNTGKFKFYRVLGTGGPVTVATTTIGEVNSVLATSYNQSAYPKGICSIDTDNDGKYNHQDADSDGDGCSDSYEAGAITAETANNQFAAAPDTNANGLNDTKENGTTGTMNYSSTYNQYAISNTFNLCADFDSDGVGDLTDIDDDNDGILDAVEAPSCYYTTSEANTLVTVRSSLTSLDDDQSDGDIQMLHDALGTLTFNYVAGQAINGASLLIMEYPTAVQLSQLSFINNTAFGTGALARLEGSQDGLTWINLGNGNVDLNNVITPKTFNNTNTGKFKFYRVFGTGGTVTVAATTIGEVNSILATSYNQSANPKGICSKDTDNDGKYNHQDADSDGDGCSDSYEAGAITAEIANNQFVAIPDTNANGLNDTKENGTTGTINYSSSYNQYALSSNINSCADFDNDGVGDIADIDDDNDGVLDTDEGCVTSMATSVDDFNGTFGILGSGSRDVNNPPGAPYSYATINTVEGQYAVISNISGASWHSNMSGVLGHSTGATNDAFLAVNGAATQAAAYNVTFTTTSEWGYNIGFWLQNVVNVASNPAEYGIRLKDQSTNVVLFDKSSGSIPSANRVWVLTDGLLILPAGTYELEIYNVTVGAAGNDVAIDDIFVRPIPAYCSLDTDGDGVSNHLDLDSDGDGCSDSYEAGAIASETANNQFAATPDANNNGLNDSKETGSTGTINYLSTYNQLAVYNALKLCTDSDNDGKSDFSDIDDDNDGVLDATESPSCFYTEAEANTLMKVRSSLTSPDDSQIDGDIQILHDASATLTFNYDAGQAINGASLLIMEYSTAVQLSQLSFVNNTTFGASATARLEGSQDGLTWTNLGNGDVALSNTTSPKTFNNTNTGKFKYYRVLGTAGPVTVVATTIGEVNSVLATSYNPSANPKGTCSTDTDSDGKYNHQDLDSDGDGCSDSYEAGAITAETANNQFAATPDTNANGLNDTKENGTTGTINYSSTYNQYATSNALNLCADFDSDGVGDLVDIDDDNDGVLDTDEGCVTSMLASTDDFNGTFGILGSGSRDVNNPPGAPYNYATTNTLAAQYAVISNISGASWHSNMSGVLGHSTGATNDAFLGINGAATQATVYNTTFTTTSEWVYNIGFWLQNVVNVASNPAEYGIRLKDQSTNAILFDKPSGSIPSANRVWVLTDGLLILPAGTYELEIYNVSVAGNNVAIDDIFVRPVSAYCSLDTDGDGVSNHLDLDSDGDGCSDSYEAGAIASETANNQFAATPDANNNGLNDSKETGSTGTINYLSTYNQFAVYNALKLCTDSDNDGKSDFSDIDDDNDGVLDATESPSCFYTEAEANTLMKVRSSLTSPDDSQIDGDIQILHDASATLTFNYDAGQAINGASLLIMEYPTAVQLSQLSFVNNTTFGASATARLEGSQDGLTWINLGNGDVALSNTTSPKTFNNTNTGKFKYYRVLGTAGPVTVVATTIGEVNSVLATSYNPSANPKGICLTDTDNDGKYNHQDADSDGDGCSDSYEAGAITAETANNQFAAAPDTNANGLNDTKENGTTGTINYSSTYNQYATSNALNLCADFDNDGVGDLVDIDDDNDGVLDALELLELNCSGGCSIPTVNDTLGQFYFWDNDNGANCGFCLANTYIPNWGEQYFNYIQNAPTISGMSTPYTGPLTGSASSLSQAVTENDYIQWEIATSCNAVIFDYVGFYAIPSAPQIRVEISTSPTFTNSTLLYTGGITASWSNEVQLTTDYLMLPNTTYYIREYWAGMNGAGDPAPSLGFRCPTSQELSNTIVDIDTDNDGVSNRFDLDSDGDGCSDSYEAGAITAETANNQFAAAPDTNANGLNDTKENGTTSTINYSSTYNQYAIFSALNLCTDFDNDGVGDLTDIDDDNDGVLDAVESPNCYYTATEANTLVTVTSSLTSPDDDQSDGDIQMLHDALTTLTFNYTAGQTINGASLLIMEYPTAVQISQLSFVNNTTFGASSTARLEGSQDGLVWTNLSNGDVALSNTTDPKVFNNTNTGKYKFYRVLGTAGSATVATTTIGEVNSVLATSYNPSANPKGICLTDTDNDGKYNHQDADSDGDGCSDSYEAGAITAETANNQFAAAPDTNANGLNDTKENGTTGTINYSSTYNQYAIFSALNLCTDFDSDGVGDLTDIDDDNDGVLDAVESPSCFYTAAEANTLVTVRSSLTSPDDDQSDGDIQILHDSLATLTFSYTAGQAISGASLLIMEYPTAVQLSQISFTNNTTFGTSATARIEGSQDGLTWTNLGNGDVALSNTTSPKTFNNTNTGKYKFYRVLGTAGSATVATTTIGEVNSVLATSYNPSANPKGICSTDTDNDGEYNHQDADSDGDGCSDSYEAGAITAETANNQFAAAPDTNANGLNDTKENGTTGTINYSSTYNQYATSNALNLCADSDSDGVGDLTDIDDDNDGILDITEQIEMPCSTEICTSWIAPPFSTASSTGTVIVDNQEVTYTVTKSGTALVSQGSGGTGSLQCGLGTVSGLPDWQRAQGGESVTFTFSKPVTNFEFILSAIESAPPSLIEQVRIDTNNTTGQQLVCESCNKSEIITSSTTQTLVNGNGTAPEIYKVSGTTYTSVTVTVTSVGGSFFLTYGLCALQTYYEPSYEDIDTDSDGIANRIDLDSDGDGCPDAKESGVTGTLLNGNVVNTSGAVNSPNAIAQGPYGLNGLANPLENNDTSSAGTSYPSTYSLYASSSSLNTCLDLDVDSIPDTTDIDDDNDGIVDSIESPSCFYSPSEFKSLTNITSDLSFDSTTQPLSFAFDGDTATWGTITAGYVSTRDLIEFNLPESNSLPIATVTVQIGINNSFPGSSMQLQGWNGTAWEAMSAAQAMTTANMTYTFTNTLQTAKPYNKFRIHGLAGTVTGGTRLHEVNYTFGAPFVSNALPKSVCNSDLDGDSISNYKDLDSDGDGCPDAKESGIIGTLLSGSLVNTSGTVTAPNAIAEGPYGTNGLANALENNDTSSATTSYTSTYNLYALGATLNNCSDSDNDGILDLADIDDDNDGVVDATESPDCYYTAVEANKIIAVTSQFTSPDAFTLLTDGDSTTKTFNFDAFTVGQNLPGSTIFALEYPTNIKLSSITLTDDISTTVGAAAIVKGSNDNVNWTSLSSSTLITNTAGTTFALTAPANTIGYKYYKIETSAPAGGAALAIANTIGEITSVVATDYISSAHPKTSCTFVDTDSDGTINILDTDSDGDGCSDAYESGATTDISTNYQFPSNLTLDTNQDGLVNIVDNGANNGTANDGKTDYVSTYQYAQSSTLTMCQDLDGDTVPDLVDLDDDNDGILDLTESTCADPYMTFPIANALNNTTGNVATGIGQYTTTASGNVFDLSGNTMGASTQYGYSSPNTTFAVLRANTTASPTAPAIATFTLTQPVQNFKFKIFNLGSIASPATNENIRVKAYNGSTLIKSTNLVGSNILYNVATEYYYSTATTSQDDTNDAVTFSYDLPVDKIVVEYHADGRSTSTTTNGIGILILSGCNKLDSDLDGITNDLDLDSDGDGCADAIEGDGPFGLNSITSSSIDGGNTGVNYIGISTLPISDNLGNNVSANGVPLIAGTGQGAGNSQISGPDLDQNGIGDECQDPDGDNINYLDDLDDDNDGILDIDEAVCANPGVQFINNGKTTFWTFDNTTNSVNSGSGTYNATDSNGPTYSSGSLQGDAANFNGSSNFVRYNNGAGFMESALSKTSIAMWIKPANFSNIGILYEEGNSTNGLVLYMDNGKLKYTVTSGGVSQTVTHPATFYNNWYHVAATFDGGQMNLYVDGQALSPPVTTSFTSIGAHTDGSGFGGVIGASNAAGVTGFYNGLMDAVSYSNTIAWTKQYISFESLKVCDNDGDGLYNQIDLDADGDNCPDVIEGGGGFKNSDLVMSTMSGGSTNIQVNLGTTSDANGVPTIANGGQDAGYALIIGPDADNNGIGDSCEDFDGDGIADLDDLDDDNDGITDTTEGYPYDPNCLSLVYQFVGDSGQLRSYNFNTGVANNIGQPVGFPIEAIGFVSLDSHIWGVNGTTGAVVRVNKLTAALESFTIPNLPTNIEFTTGDDINGYLMFYNAAGSSYYTVDINPSRSTYLQLVDPTAGYALETSNFGTPISTPVNASDWAYSTTNGLFYYVIDGGAPNAYQIGTFNPITGQTLLTGVTANGFTSETFGSQYMDREGNFYVYGDTSGKYYKVDLTSGNILQVGSVTPIAGGSDGASCSDAVLKAFNLDIDNDGIVNWKDLDSDGDNCADAIEGDGGFTTANLVTSTLPGGSTNVQTNLGNTVDVNGIPTIANSGQQIGTSNDFTLLSSECQIPCKTISGVVEDLNGNPLQNIEVEIYADGNGDGLINATQDLLLSTVTTDALGFYSHTRQNYVIISDGFEGAVFSGTNNFSGNYNGWIENSWIQSNTADSGIITTPASDDNLAVQHVFLENNSTLTRAMDLSYATIANLTFDFDTSDALDTGDQFFAEVSTDGGATFSSVYTYTDDGMDNHPKRSETINLSSFVGFPSTTIRFRTTASEGEFVWLDNVRVHTNFPNVIVTPVKKDPYISAGPDNEVLVIINDTCTNVDFVMQTICDTYPVDTDGDSICDANDLDDDNDGILDRNEAECTAPTAEFINVNKEAFWRFNNDTNDSSTNSYNQVSADSPTYSTIDAVEGGVSASFDGISNYVQYNADGFMNKGFSSMSIAMWIKPDVITGNRILYEEGDNTNGAILYLNNGLLNYTVTEGGVSTTITSQTTLGVQEWKHVGASFDKGELNVYINGIKDNSAVIAGYNQISTHTDDGAIGGGLGNNAAGVTGFYSGLIDAVSYSNKVAWTDDYFNFEGTPLCDTDGDGLYNHLDLDSDGDNCSDAVEGAGSFLPADLISSTISGGSTNINSNLGNNVDANGIPNTALGGQEVGTALLLGPDIDLDGIADTCDCYDNTLADNDGDGVPNVNDVDSDNDGIANAVEGSSTIDTDGDNIPNYLDLDSDNDGIPDAVEVVGDTAVASTLINCHYDDGNIIVNNCETGESVIGFITPIDTDGDSLPDYLDLDSDGDSCNDAVEAGFDTTTGGVNVDLVNYDNSISVTTNGLTNTVNCGIPVNDNWKITSVNCKSIELTKTATFNDGNSNGFADAGETITYSFQVTNTGTVTLSNVSITDPLVTVSGTIASLAPAAVDTVTFSATYTITQADVDAGNVTNLATATGTDPSGGTVSDTSDDPATVTPDDSTVVTFTANGTIALTKTATFNDVNTNGIAEAGETITYSFQVTNTGTV
ncbi:LamG-like jellyroll fold domain-containing protein, partial [Flavobacterium sp. LHD-80]|uniref:DUF7507 domain-containing protein n=1 Tax=Flavobacterium sp. LHD-80 TaxID=3071411 RepID=UPI0027E1DADA